MERASLYDFLGDLVVYRNLEPADGRLQRPEPCPEPFVPGALYLSPLVLWPKDKGSRTSAKGPGPRRRAVEGQGFPEFWEEVRLPSLLIPRKAEPVYAQAILHLLAQAQALRSDKRLQRLIYIGDTAMNDGQAIRNLDQRLPTRGFIGHEGVEESRQIEVEDGVMLANRWAALADFVHFLQEEGFALDEATAALVDLDKTAFGARGRNSQAIDAARVEAVRRTVEEVLGDFGEASTVSSGRGLSRAADFDEGEFRAVYDKLNQPRYHPFTADNQDYLAYICLMVSGGVYDFTQLLADLEAERLSSFAQFIEACAERSIGDELAPVHQEVYTNFRRGDPTPFKSFRYREYEETVRRMDRLSDDAGEEMILAEEIVITREVADVCRFLRGKGVLLFGLTDKPDESSIPRPELAQKGYLPLHRVTLKVVGNSIYGDLIHLT